MKVNQIGAPLHDILLVTNFLRAGAPLLSQFSRRCYAIAARKEYDAIVIGAGPGGLTCVSNLLDQGFSKVAMIDDRFNAGRIMEKYREVPSNTKTTMFKQWATGTKAFENVIQQAPPGNPYEKLLTFDQDSGCQLGDAIQVAKLLSDGLREDPRVDSIQTRVNELQQVNKTWILPELNLETKRVVLAVGSHPRPHDLADRYSHISRLDLETCLKPSLLPGAVPKKSRVAVIGSSHSAVLALKNLHEVPDIEVVNFYRTDLLYAEYKDGWILYDNTGLKGVAADWARDVLASKELPNNLRRVNLKADERSELEIYDAELQDCTHLVSAIGYDINPLPRIIVDDTVVTPAYDPLTGRFLKKKGGKEVLSGLFGAGIAYPEQVTDKAGNVESAVGWFKFMKFLRRVAPEWSSRP